MKATKTKKKTEPVRVEVSTYKQLVALKEKTKVPHIYLLERLVNTEYKHVFKARNKDN
jgi:hypothetical protein